MATWSGAWPRGSPSRQPWSLLLLSWPVPWARVHCRHYHHPRWWSASPPRYVPELLAWASWQEAHAKGRRWAGPALHRQAGNARRLAQHWHLQLLGTAAGHQLRPDRSPRTTRDPPTRGLPTAAGRPLHPATGAAAGAAGAGAAQALLAGAGAAGAAGRAAWRAAPAREEARSLSWQRWPSHCRPGPWTLPSWSASLKARRLGRTRSLHPGLWLAGGQPVLALQRLGWPLSCPRSPARSHACHPARQPAAAPCKRRLAQGPAVHHRALQPGERRRSHHHCWWHWQQTQQQQPNCRPQSPRAGRSGEGRPRRCPTDWPLCAQPLVYSPAPGPPRPAPSSA